jgi:hypothetical protein
MGELKTAWMGGCPERLSDRGLEGRSRMNNQIQNVGHSRERGSGEAEGGNKPQENLCRPSEAEGPEGNNRY